MARHCANPACPGLERDGTPPEFVDSVVRCIDCGGTLMLGHAPAPSNEPPRFNDLATAWVATDLVQAHLLRGVLEAEGIGAFLKGEKLTGAVGELPADVVQIEVQVPAENLERAREVAARFEGTGTVAMASAQAKEVDFD